MPEPDADERLLVEAAQRDSSKFGDLYERHFERVYAFVARRVEDRAAAEDVTAEVFHKALAGLRSYQWRGAPFGAWLIRNRRQRRHRSIGRAARSVVNSDALPAPGSRRRIWCSPTSAHGCSAWSISCPPTSAA